VRSVSASTDVFANAYLTMMAFVENSTAPKNVMRNPAREIFLIVSSDFILNYWFC
jgi:hypothetical protein